VDAAALVYSIASRPSFEHLEHFRQVATMAKSERGEDLVIAVVGSKCDREEERQVTKEEGEELARRFGCGFGETSAKTGQNVERVLADLVRSLRETRSAISGADGALQKWEEKKKKKCITL
jgi:GTPase KRas protein